MVECYINAQPPNMDGIYCPPIHDTFTCWSSVEKNMTVWMPCPTVKGSDVSKYVSKFCDIHGQWRQSPDDNSATSTDIWTNYTTCFTEELSALMKSLKRLSKEDFYLRGKIAELVRIMELIGLSFSLKTIIISLLIYICLKNLRNDKTLIHMNLFLAIFCSSLTKLIIFVDQLIVGYNITEYEGFDNTPILCEIAFIILEYSKSATEMWMFIEALHLHKAVCIAATPVKFLKAYILFGWGIPFVLTAAWAAAMLYGYNSHCWFGYDQNTLYWILDFPRMCILVINTCFLTKIIQIVFIKLRRDISNELQLLRKLAKSVMALILLLGITNYISYAQPSVDGPLPYFIFYIIVAYFLSSFQGALICLIFCIMNEDVKKTVFLKLGFNRTVEVREENLMLNRMNNNREVNLETVSDRLHQIRI